MRIIVVEDDDLIIGRLAKVLNEQHYTVDFAKDGEAAWELLDCFTYDLILLDVMLPKLDGISLCRKLRSQGNKTPILLLTAQDTSTNKVMGLDAGADDFLAKPFDFQELLARIRALLRRGGSSVPPTLVWHNLQLDPSTCSVTCNGQLLHLTPKEYSLLELFLRNTHRVFSCGMLIEHLWSFEEPPSDDTVRSHIKGLRQKLKAAGVDDEPIETVYGIGYRLKPADKEKGKAQIQRRKEGSQSPIQNQITTGVSQVWEQVAQTLNQRVSVIEEASNTLLQNQLLSEDARSKVRQEAHKLVGSLGMFGSDKGSYLASEIESFFVDGVRLDNSQIIHLSQLVHTLRDCLQSMNGEETEALVNSTPTLENPLLLVVDQDRELTDDLINHGSSWGIRIQGTCDPMTARNLIEDSCPDIVLLDLSYSDTVESTLSLLTELTNRTPPLPVVVTTARDSLIDRVKIARLGGRGVLQKPTSSIQVLKMVTQVLQNTRVAEARIMVVDDDPQILTALHNLLTPWGCKVYTLADPLCFWEVMTAVAPDLLILDVQMPEINGIELCKVVRSDSRWSGVPILFLTAHKDAKTRQQVFIAGADDYISKPIVKAELVTRILNRLERTRLLKSLAETDVLTGVANRSKSIQELTRCIQWSQTYHQPFCLAIVEVGKLKQINQQYGYVVGDRVLSRLGRILRLNFHSEDVVGRWGGTEFVVGICGMTRIEASRCLSEVIKSLHQSDTTTIDTLYLTFNTGIAQYPEDGADVEALYRVANAVLEQQKAAETN
ncbi:MAG: response regulator [Calothrix sp. C42_A2020_038]|nr:response regulator [Calothrix sp. C42_A2020_038]